MTLQTQVEVKGCFYTGAIGCGNLRTTCTVLSQYCRGTEQIFTVKGSFDIATVIGGFTVIVPRLIILTNQIALYQVNKSHTNLVCQLIEPSRGTFSKVSPDWSRQQSVICT